MARYKTSRTLVRAILRQPGESKETFSTNVNLLRRHFERFNLDVSELCQLVMSMRPGGKLGSDAARRMWNFLFCDATLEQCASEDERTDIRFALFMTAFQGRPVTEDLRNSLPGGADGFIDELRSLPQSNTAKTMLGRFALLAESHQRILFKSAVECISARYINATENWKRSHEVWEKEKSAWETAHLHLTQTHREQFNSIFQQMGVREKNPRICRWDILKQNRDNCRFAGERILRDSKSSNHGPLCKKYQVFAKKTLGAKKKEYFPTHAELFLKISRENPQKTHAQCLDIWKGGLAPNERVAEEWFPDAWEKYLEALGLDSTRLRSQSDGKLPHCTKIDKDNDCRHNPHTDLCTRYPQMLTPELQSIEGEYREWRSRFLAGPSKPSFRYPSKSTLPLPKILGLVFTGLTSIDR